MGTWGMDYIQMMLQKCKKYIYVDKTERGKKWNTGVKRDIVEFKWALDDEDDAPLFWFIWQIQWNYGRFK